MVESIVDLINAEPFHPFKIILTSGEVHEIPNPNLVAVGKSVIVLCWPKSDRISILRQNQIVSIDVPQAA